jgi:hypothetical protein
LLVSRPRYRSSGSAAFVVVRLLFIIFLLGFPVCVSARVSEARYELWERAFPAISNTWHQSQIAMVKGEIGDSSSPADGAVVRDAPNSGVVELPLLTKGNY